MMLVEKCKANETKMKCWKIIPLVIVGVATLGYLVMVLWNTHAADCCFLEIEQPDIASGIENAQKNNPQVLVIVFYFLHEGAHVKTDINQDLKPALERSNLQQVYITEHIGVDEKMIDLILERAREVENAN